MRLGIPYKVVGGTRFYDRREIKDALAYLKAVVNPADEVSVKRVLNVPKRGVGDASVGQARRARGRATGIAFVDALRRGRRGRASPGPAVTGIASFVDLLDDLAAMVAPSERRPGRRCCRRRSTRTGYLAELEAEHTVEAEGRLENLAELVGSAREFTRLDEFLEQVALVADTDELDGDDDQVVLMTLHSAKGLEFPVVFLDRHGGRRVPAHPRARPSPTSWRRSAAWPTSASPGPRSGSTSRHAWSRTLFGSTQYNPPSRFLDEIPAELVNEQGNVGGRSSYGRQSYRQRASYGGDPPPVPAAARAHVRPRRGRGGAPPRAGRRCGDQRRPPRGEPVASEPPRDRPARRRRRRAPVVRRGRDPRHPRSGRQGRGDDPLPRRRHQAPRPRLGAAQEALTTAVRVAARTARALCAATQTPGGRAGDRLLRRRGPCPGWAAACPARSAGGEGSASVAAVSAVDTSPPMSGFAGSGAGGTPSPSVFGWASALRGRGLLLRRRDADGRGRVGAGQPAAAADDRQRAQQPHRHLVLLGGAGDDRAVVDHPVDDLLAELGAHDGQRPVVVLADPAGGDVGVLGGEVGAVLAALAGPARGTP